MVNKKKKINCAVMVCNNERYLMCTSEDYYDMIEKASMWCKSPEQSIENIDIIELESEKRKIKTEKRENDLEILDIEIK